MPPGTPESARKIALVPIPERPRAPEFRPSDHFRFRFVLPTILCNGHMAHYHMFISVIKLPMLAFALRFEVVVLSPRFFEVCEYFHSRLIDWSKMADTANISLQFCLI